MDLAELDKKYLWHPFTPMRLWLESEPLVIEHGKGVYLYDTRGRRYIDGVSSLWCNVHGHNHEDINTAIKKQLEKIAHSTLLGLSSRPAIELAAKLIKIAPAGLSRVFYSDSGAAAVEIAIKIAYQYWRNLGQKPRSRFIALKQSYHGDTIGSVSVGGIKTFREIYEPLTFAVDFCDNPNPYRYAGEAEACKQHCLGQMERILQQRAGEVAAIIVEPLVQGAAGIIVHPGGFLRSVKELARQYEVLLIADEVATGFGRTGTMFACPQEEVSPDILCLGKGITGGYLPLAATLVSERIFEAFCREPWQEKTFYHGHTYTGNALGCAAALASLEVFEKEKTIQNLPDNIAVIAKYLQQIRKLDYVGDVRQKGMMAGIELVADQKSKNSFDPAKRIGAKLCQSLRDRGVILRPLGDVMVIMPPLVIRLDELNELMTIAAESIINDLPQLIDRSDAE